MKRWIYAAVCGLLTVCLTGCFEPNGPNVYGWFAIRLTKTYKIDIDHPYGDRNETPYLFKQTGVYGDSYARIGRLYIWTQSDKKVYMLAYTAISDMTYYLLDQETDELDFAANLTDFEEEAQEIFKKLESHPELYAEM